MNMKNIIGLGMMILLIGSFVGFMVYSIGILPAAGVLGITTVLVIWLGVSVNLMDS